MKLPLSDLSSIQLKHLISSVTLNEADKRINDHVSTIEGYTEWISPTSPTISIGWDWITVIKKGRLVFLISGYPYSNMTLIDKSGRALSEQVRLNRLKSFVESIDWQETVKFHITM
ncbi:DUF4902 domain-containing protein [Microbulbifer sp. ZKSA006]|uniref:DUF4902 domain-containing protein n=1 Tax=Microbulbifer sp. ZKSA006 TaxID=3243390 RepID=UPI0040398D51